MKSTDVLLIRGTPGDQGGIKPEEGKTFKLKAP